MARDENDSLVERIQAQVKNGKIKVTELHEYAAHAEGAVRAAALRGLWEFPTAETLALLIRAAESETDLEARAAACASMGRWIWAGIQMDAVLDPSTGLADGIVLSDVAGVRARLKAIWEDPGAPLGVRRAALKALCYDPQPDEQEIVLGLWKGEDLETRLFGLECMGRAAVRRWQDILASTLYSTNRAILLAGMQAVAEACVEKAEARLLELALGQDRELALEAIWALRNVLHSPHARRALERMSRGKDQGLKARARETLAELDAMDVVETPDVEDD